MANDLLSLQIDLDKITVSESSLIDSTNLPDGLRKNQNSLKIITHNIRSIYRNFDQFVVFLNSLGTSPDIFVFTECWLSTDKVLPQIDNYLSHYSHTCLNQNDGVVIYIHKDIAHTIEEPTFGDANCLIIKSHKLAMLCIYRSPSHTNIDNFLNSLDYNLKSLHTFDTVVVIGDINIDIKTSNSDRKSQEYLNLLAEHGLLPGHTIPTRGANCLDHIIIRSDNIAQTFVIKSSITDHFPVLLHLNKLKKRKSPTLKTITNYEMAAETLKNTIPPNIVDIVDPNKALTLLIKTIQNALDANTITRKAPNRKQILKPWITPGLLRCIKHRDALHQKHKDATEDNNLKLTYSRYRNFCNALLKKIRDTYEQGLINNCSTPKETWKIIRKVTDTKKVTIPAEELLNLNSLGAIYSVNKINEYFASAGHKLINKISNNDISKKICKIQNNSCLNSFGLFETDDKEIEALILSLKNDSARGSDGIPTSFLKLIKDTLTPILTHIFNLCLKNGIFPDHFKHSIIHPIHKGGDRDCVDNYRPISILSTLSKLLEKIINKRLINYLTKEKIISEAQFGFQQNKSTEDAITQLVNNVTSNLDRGNKCIGVFLDLAKAFDTVSLATLLSKLQNVGIRGLPLQLFESFLTHRTQATKIGNYISNPLPISCGVPQGSVLGPSLFLVYINDLCRFQPENGKIFSYADDTALIFKGETWAEARIHAERGLHQVTHWLNMNLLTLNISKSKFITFSINKSTQPKNLLLKAHTCSNTTAACSCLTLEQTDTIRYLGVQVDNTLSWNSQINILSSRTRKLIWIFKKLSNKLNPCLIKTVYYALAQSVLCYCISVWGGTCKTRLIKLERAQRSVLKVMSRRPYRYPTNSLHEECKILTVRQLFIQQLTLRTHRQLTYDPSLVSSARRKKNVCKSIFCKTAFLRRHAFFLASYLYNKLNNILDLYPKTIRECRRSITKYLKNLSYIDTENLFTVMR